MSQDRSRRKSRFAWAVAATIVIAGCNGLSLSTLFPGIVLPGTGTITVKRIITQDPPNATTNFTFPIQALVDGLGFKWDIADDGHVTDGGKAEFPDAFDKIMELETFVPGFAEKEFEPGTLDAKMEDGREIVIGPILWDGGLTITRKIFVSATHGFCRWLDIFTNPNDTPFEFESENKGNLGSDEDNNNVFISSNGNTTVEEGDVWWINGQQFATDPTVAAFYCGHKDSEKTQDNVVFDYGKHQMVPAHGRNIVTTFLFQRSLDRSSPTSLLDQEVGVIADLTKLMKSLETYPSVAPEFLEGISADEVNDLRNCGGNVVVNGTDGSVNANAGVVVTNTANGSTRSGVANGRGGFGPINVKGAMGDSIEITADGGARFTHIVP